MTMLLWEWWKNPIALTVLAVFFALAWFLAVYSNRSQKKYKEDNPEVATIWIVPSRGRYGVKIKLVDNGFPHVYSFSYLRGRENVYVMPGNHVLLVEYNHFDKRVSKKPEYQSRKFTEMLIFVEAGKDYNLLYGEDPGEYTLAEGKPE